MASQPYQRKLTALQFDYPKTFNPDEPKQFRTLVLWLEEMKIRFYELPQRAALRHVESNTWDVAFAKYLSDLGCVRAEAKGPVSGLDATAKKNRAVLLDWLLNQAVFAEYKDDAANYNAVSPLVTGGHSAVATTNVSAAAAAAAAVPTSAPAIQLSTDGKDFETAVQQLAAVLKLPAVPASPDPAVTLKVIRERLTKFVADRNAAAASPQVPSAGSGSGSAMQIDSKSSGSGGATPAGTVPLSASASAAAAKAASPNAQLDEMELGFPSTGDVLVDRAAKVLRLLYIADLRQLQTLINETIVSIQEYTANPTTDARLGVVGV